MTFFEPIIDRLRVQSFRGFRDAREFDLSASAVIVTGPNGTGKTSFFDALQWGLLGSLERLEDLRSRRSVEHVVNQYRLGYKASVEIDLILQSGPVTVRRVGDHGGSTLELRGLSETALFGEEAEVELRRILLPRTEMALDSALATSGLMQQDVMRRVLEAKPADRYRQLSTVLGLGALEDFEDAARSLAKQASEREKSARTERARITETLKKAQDRLEAAQTLLATRPRIEAVRDEVLDFLAATPPGISFSPTRLALERPDDVRVAATALGRALSVIESAQKLINQASQLRNGLPNSPTDEELNALRAEVTRAESERDTAEAMREEAKGQLEAARRTAADVVKLAVLAVPLLADDCPVCGQSIDREQLERELRERAESTDTLLELELAVSQLVDGSNRAAAATIAARQLLTAAEQQVDRWRQVRNADFDADAAVKAVADIDIVRFERYDVNSFAEASVPALEYIRGARHLLHELLETFDRQSEQGAVERTAAEIRSIEIALSSAENQLSSASVRSQRLQALSEQTIEARVEVTEERLQSIQPLVANIFQRLDPHPAFKTVEFELNTYYKKGTTVPLVIDQVENISADPLLIFSTSQANIVALSYFIAMSLSSEERGLPFLLLDDPVQSMDDVNVLGFADLCRHLRLRRQLIVSTHERRFASLLERKLAPRSKDSRTKVIKFTGWDRSGPTVQEYFVEPQLLEDPIRLVHMAG